MTFRRLQLLITALATTLACGGSTTSASSSGDASIDGSRAGAGGTGTGGSGTGAGGTGESGGYVGAGGAAPTGGSSGTGGTEMGGAAQDGGQPGDEGGIIAVDAGVECLPDGSGQLIFQASGPFMIDAKKGNDELCFGASDASGNVQISFTVPVPGTDLLALIVLSIDALPKGQRPLAKPVGFTMLLAGEKGDIWKSDLCTIDVTTNVEAGMVDTQTRYKVGGVVHCAADIPGLRNPSPPLHIDRFGFITAVLY